MGCRNEPAEHCEIYSDPKLPNGFEGVGMSQKGRMFYAYSQTVAFEIIGAADLNVSRINNLHVFFMFKAIGHTFNVLKSTKHLIL